MESKATNNEQSTDPVLMKMRKELDVSRPKIRLKKLCEQIPHIEQLRILECI